MGSQSAQFVQAPLVLVPSCQRVLGRHPFHVVGQKYVDAIRLAGAVPLMVPGASEAELSALLSVVDGVLLTGSPSNVHPRHFDEDVLDERLPLDPVRDAWTLPLIRAVVERGIPLLGICRGLQEVNVALGGSLHQAVQGQPGHMDHRADEALPVEQEYGLAHAVAIQPGGVLDPILRGLDVRQGDEVMVNSLHGQGVKRLAPGLHVEARAPDGVVEAFSKPGGGFNLCLQWHPEWLAASNPVSLRIFEAFGQACRAHQAIRLGLAAPA
ncbi:gamma-glutamyl-gamma-aminobutyrate hydrolase [Aquabacterium commune]|uniref:gamma-glutamyl-gamma-aminobutyrate hydrolase n=1 Tax=Aquabacterium commune TaxID=70586 RepID=A0A4R6RB29_9BURK|nr:gamma-glutamyl-gamma-aminobutyrate hydrolase family protein [Aquabacterium commune]TDP82826.1 gamma-glutamyl-gamma-aminobutyrate hydrolase [Aquabacterium commune]